MSRHQISASVPADIAERLSDAGARNFTPEELKEARAELVEQLVSGESVNRITRRDVFDFAIQDEGKIVYHGILDLLEGILGVDERTGGDRQLATSDLISDARGVIERYVDANEDLIEEHAAKIANERTEEE